MAVQDMLLKTVFSDVSDQVQQDSLNQFFAMTHKHKTNAK